MSQDRSGAQRELKATRAVVLQRVIIELQGAVAFYGAARDITQDQVLKDYFNQRVRAIAQLAISVHGFGQERGMALDLLSRNPDRVMAHMTNPVTIGNVNALLSALERSFDGDVPRTPFPAHLRGLSREIDQTCQDVQSFQSVVRNVKDGTKIPPNDLWMKGVVDRRAASNIRTGALVATSEDVVLLGRMLVGELQRCGLRSEGLHAQLGTRERGSQTRTAPRPLSSGPGSGPDRPSGPETPRSSMTAPPVTSRSASR